MLPSPREGDREAVVGVSKVGFDKMEKILVEGVTLV